MAADKKKPSDSIGEFDHGREFTRKSLPTGEFSGSAPEDLIGRTPPIVSRPIPNATARDRAEIAGRDPDLDPQYVWRGKFKEGRDCLEVKAPFIYQQEKIFPRLLIEDVRRRAAARRNEESPQMDLFENAGISPGIAPGFYEHEEGWKNRMILGDSLQVMASLAENESLRGKVQMVYMDPPYGIKFNSNWQPSTQSTNVTDGKRESITREPEMVKAFRDTWHDGIHSYLGYLRDRLIFVRDLLTESGSCFVQMSMENVHKIRALMDEVFGESNCVSMISYATTSGVFSATLDREGDYILWYARNKNRVKYRELYKEKDFGKNGSDAYSRIMSADGEGLTIGKWETLNHKSFDYSARGHGERIYSLSDLTSQGKANVDQPFPFKGKVYNPKNTAHWKPNYPLGMERLKKAARLEVSGKTLRYIRYLDDFPVMRRTNYWGDTGIAGFASDKVYIVQTSKKVIERCMLMTTSPGDLVLDPTCGSGTTAFVAEQWGRRWITIDTSRVALALARKRLMTAVFPYYLLADSDEGVEKERELTGRAVVCETFGRISMGFVYARVPHVTLKAIANDAEIDIIWGQYEDEARRLLGLMGLREEWEIPFNAPAVWAAERLDAHKAFQEMRRKRQGEIDASIARAADTEYLYDRPFEDKKRFRVAGPFTVESVAPARAMIAGADGAFTDPISLIAKDVDYGNGPDYVARMLKILARNGVKQSRKDDRISFDSVMPWQGKWIIGDAWDRAEDGRKARHYAIALGPEFGAVTRNDMMQAKKEALEGGFDVLLYCAFCFEAYVEEGGEDNFGRLKVLHARMNSDLHMSTDLKDTGTGNPFVIFGEPDFSVDRVEGDLYTVTIKGVDVFDPKTGDVRCDDAGAIDCWMIDTDYNGQAFFARQVYFPRQEDAYGAFRKMLGGDIGREEWDALSRTVSLPFERPASGRIAVKVINYFGDEVMRICKI